MKNIEVRTSAAQSGIRHWEIAEKLGISEGTFCRKLRRELSEQEKQRILCVIQQLQKEA